MVVVRFVDADLQAMMALLQSYKIYQDCFYLSIALITLKMHDF